MSLFDFLLCLLAFNQLQLGQSGVADNHRIVEGDLAKPGEIKYIVSLLHDSEFPMCGGGIIDEEWILTAAHCLLDENDKISARSLAIMAGTNDYNDEDDPRRVVVEVEKAYVPKSYTSHDYPNDIALLKLRKSLDIEKNDLKKLKLPKKSLDLDNHMALMAGFGYDQHRSYIDWRSRQYKEEGTSSGLLRKADIKIFSNPDCQDLYPKDKIHDSYLCGKMVKKSQWLLRKEYGVCNGDSGSPLVYNSTAVGVVSWSYGCDEREVPLVYTRVSSFLDFIKDAKNDKTAKMRVKVFK